ncbi:MAG: hypothetical protein IKJ74_03150 [Clostridia bacterium]|nr:hypothetical protein [Clostridia bacterium]
MEITFKNLMDWIMKGLVFILILAVLFGAGTFVFTKYFVKPTYTSQVKFYASGTSENKSDYMMANYYRDVVPQYVEFLNVNEFYEMVAKDLKDKVDASLTPKDIAACINFSSIVEDTSSFFVVVKTPDPALSYNVARSISEMAPKQIQNFENVGALEVLSYPVMPTAPSGPYVLRNSVIGFLAGLVLAVALVVIREITDNRIRTPEEITEFFGLPVFGVVPDFESGEKKGGHRA